MQGSQGTRQGPHDVKTISNAMAHDVEHGRMQRRESAGRRTTYPAKRCKSSADRYRPFSPGRLVGRDRRGARINANATVRAVQGGGNGDWDGVGINVERGWTNSVAASMRVFAIAMSCGVWLLTSCLATPTPSRYVPDGTTQGSDFFIAQIAIPWRGSLVGWLACAQGGSSSETSTS